MSIQRSPRTGGLVHRPVRAYPGPVPADGLTIAAPPTVGWGGSGVAGWLQYLVPLLAGGGSLAFLFAVPGPRPGWLVAVVAGGALASVVLGFGLRLVDRRSTRRRQRNRYLAHLDRVAVEVARRASAQRAAAEYLHPDPPRLPELVDRHDRLWERRPTDDDFLEVRIGRGPVALATPIRLDPGGGPLADHDPELLSAAHALLRHARWLPDAPVTVPLRRLGVLAVTGPTVPARALVRSLVCQLAALHAPDDLHIMAAFPATAGKDWAWLEWLPHTRDPTSGNLRGPTSGDPRSPPIRRLAGTPAQLAALLDRRCDLGWATSRVGRHVLGSATGGRGPSLVGRAGDRRIWSPCSSWTGHPVARAATAGCSGSCSTGRRRSG